MFSFLGNQAKTRKSLQENSARNPIIFRMKDAAAHRRALSSLFSCYDTSSPEFSSTFLRNDVWLMCKQVGTAIISHKAFGGAQYSASEVRILSAGSVLGGYYEEKLISTLMKNYSKLARPVENNLDPVNIKLGLSLQQIIDVVSQRPIVCFWLTTISKLLSRNCLYFQDEKNEMLHTNLWMNYVSERDTFRRCCRLLFLFDAKTS